MIMLLSRAPRLLPSLYQMQHERENSDITDNKMQHVLRQPRVHSTWLHGCSPPCM